MADPVRKIINGVEMCAVGTDPKDARRIHRLTALLDDSARDFCHSTGLSGSGAVTSMIRTLAHWIASSYADSEKMAIALDQIVENLRQEAEVMRLAHLEIGKPH